MKFEDIQRIQKCKEGILIFYALHMQENFATDFLDDYREYLKQKNPDDINEWLIRGLDDVNENGVYDFDVENDCLTKLKMLYNKQ